MKNNGSSDALGPRPTRTAADALPPARAAALRAVEGQAEPTPLAALATATGMRPNTLRDHLDALRGDGLVERRRAAPTGRGRPAWLYTATTDAGTGRAAGTEYAALAAALARAIHRSSRRPAEDAAVAGEDWGRDLVREHAGAAPQDRGTSATAARRAVVDVLTEVGFSPVTDARAVDVRLTRCPLLAAAHQHPEVVCSVHLGLVRGALDELGAPAGEVTLEPFAEPGACRLRMHHGRGGGR